VIKYVSVDIEIIMVIVLLNAAFHLIVESMRQPKWVSEIHNGMCMNCAAQMGPIFECPVCLENKNIIILNCNHKICNECWYIITEKGNDDYNYKSVCYVHYVEI
jgi:hypothetical protein